jgi:hypothetical protein
MKLADLFTCVECGEAYQPDPRPLGRRSCPSCASDNIVPVTSLMSRWSPPWRVTTIPQSHSPMEATHAR